MSTSRPAQIPGQIPALIPDRTSARALMLAMCCTGFVIVAVNVLIYRARIVFGRLNPDYIAAQPATISRAISEPTVGVPFAGWMAFCAPVLFVGVVALIWVAWREMVRAGGADPRRQRRIAYLTFVVGTLQGLAAMGMVMLSHFRFPDHHALHMAGSYLFFFPQAFVVVFGEFLSRQYGALAADESIVAAAGARLRRRYVWVPICLGVVYLALFILKGYDLGPVGVPLYAAYTLAEPMLLSSFLGYVLMYHYDMGTAVLRYWRAAASRSARSA